MSVHMGLWLTLFKVLLQIHFSLVASYLVFTASARLFVFFGRARRSHVAALRAAQIVFVLAILAPLAFQAVPRKALGHADFSVLRPAAESIEENLAAPAAPVSRSLVPTTSQTIHSQQAPERRSTFFIVLGALAFGLGTLFFALRFFIRLQKLRRLLSSSTKWRQIGNIRITVTDVITVPFSARMPHLSWVVLPQNLLATPQHLRLALSHELQHHRQRDTAWAMFIEIATVFFYVNPAVYFWKNEIIELQEFACDEALLGQKVSSHAYASCLVRVAEAAFGSRHQKHVGTTCMATTSKNPFYIKSFLRRRIEMFIDQKQARPQRWVGWAMGTFSVIVTMFFAFSAQQALEEAKVNPGDVQVDVAVQEIAERVLNRTLQNMRAKGGFAIVADPRTGKVLAVANRDDTRDTKFWALAFDLEPASIAKPLMVARALDKGLTTPTERHPCNNGSTRYGDRTYYDWKKNGWKTLSTTETVTLSSNVCAIRIAEKVGAQGLREMLSDFGFGPNGSASVFPKARVGEIPEEDSARPRIVPFVALGTGYNVTPLELVQAYGAIANGGTLMKPVAANAHDLQIVRRVISEKAARETREILRQVVENGTAKLHAQSAFYTTAGKTASSYTKSFSSGDGAKVSNFAGFIGFAPAVDPKVEVFVGIYGPKSKDGAHGGGHAGPVFRQIAEEVLNHWNVPPDKRNSG